MYKSAPVKLWRLFFFLVSNFVKALQQQQKNKWQIHLT